MITTAIAVAAGAWVVTPVLAIARRRTIDDRARVAMAQDPRSAAVRRAHAREAQVAAAFAEVSVPAPRSGGHDDLPQRSPIRY